MQRHVLELRLRRGAQLLGRFHVLAHRAGGAASRVQLDGVAALGAQLGIEVVFPQAATRQSTSPAPSWRARGLRA